MSYHRLCESDYRFLSLIWDSEPVNSTELVRLCASALGWKKSTVYTMVKKLAEKEALVMDGRDIGTVVLPDAIVKIFLTASVDVRTERRFEELKAKGMVCDKDQLKKEIIERDYRDTHRENSPLKKADDAVEVDTTELTIDQVIEKILTIAESKGL